jgi:hypothetical protein
VISRDPVASHSTRPPSPVADNKSKDDEGEGENNDDNCDAFEEVMRRGFAEVTREVKICSAESSFSQPPANDTSEASDAIESTKIAESNLKKHRNKKKYVSKVRKESADWKTAANGSLEMYTMFL